MAVSIVLQESERGILSINGRATRWLGPGRHSFHELFRRCQVDTFQLDQGCAVLTPELKRLMPASEGKELHVGPDEMAIVTRDGLPINVLMAGQYVLWQQRHKIEASLHDLKGIFVDIPANAVELVPYTVLHRVSVAPYQRVLLYIDGDFVQVLEAGRHSINRQHREVSCIVIDMREQELQITGQEVMTLDKVSLRLNLMIKFQVTDPRKSYEATQQLRDAIYSEAQMIARQQIAGCQLDALLEGRQTASEDMRAQLQERTEGWGIRILRIDVKDVVLPGDMKALLNRVIEAEKVAEANLILRREETAATRSLANTAKMLEKNPMLMRLKELEHLKEMAGEIHQLTLVGGAQDLLGSLLSSVGDTLEPAPEAEQV